MLMMSMVLLMTQMPLLMTMCHYRRGHHDDHSRDADVEQWESMHHPIIPFRLYHHRCHHKHVAWVFSLNARLGVSEKGHNGISARPSLKKHPSDFCP